MSVRKRTWITAKGEAREAWIVVYFHNGKRHIETFHLKKDANGRHAEVKIDIKKGIHVAASKLITVAEACKRWTDAAEAEGLQRTTVRTYRQHVDLHIVPVLGGIRLPDVTVPVVAQFKSVLRERGVSPALIKKVTVSLGSIIAGAQQHGLVAHNAVRELRQSNRRGRDKDRGDRKPKLCNPDQR